MKATKPTRPSHVQMWQKVALVVALSVLAVALAPPLAHTSASAATLDAVAVLSTGTPAAYEPLVLAGILCAVGLLLGAAAIATLIVTRRGDHAASGSKK